LIESYIKSMVLALQEFSLLAFRAFGNLFSPPLQTYRQLQIFGSVSILGELVTKAIVLELGPVLTAMVVAGRASSGISSEIGSMLVSEQIDALRALGTDPLRKLVSPRLFAAIFVLPLLTVLADFFGLLGGWLISTTVAQLSGTEYWNTAYQSLTFRDMTQGLMKPILFGMIIALVGCYFGLQTEGGTEGVGRSTTQAVVWAIVLVIMVDFFVTRLLIGIGFA